MRKEMNNIDFSKLASRLRHYRIALWIIAVLFFIAGIFKIYNFHDVESDYVLQFCRTESLSSSLIVAGIVVILIIHVLSITIESIDEYIDNSINRS